jgi:hypothetical protein
MLKHSNPFFAFFDAKPQIDDDAKEKLKKRRGATHSQM